MKLNNKVSIIVPTKIGQEAIASSTVEYWKQYILKSYSRIVGGASVIKQEGAWIDETTNDLVIEDNYMVYCYTSDSDFFEVLELTKELASDMQEKLKQDSVLYEVNGEARFS